LVSTRDEWSLVDHGHAALLATLVLRKQSVMNLKRKYRGFRPFAPSVLRERVSDWFELNTDSPYMLLVADVAAQKRRSLTDEKGL
jgi:carbamoyltransferase